jgi:hypothetical protein
MEPDQVLRVALVTGSRHSRENDPELQQLYAALIDFLPRLVIVGDCPRGVDAFVRLFCFQQGFKCRVHGANWNEFGTKAGPLRNQAMVDEVAAFQAEGHIVKCFAVPKGPSYGTRGCMRLAVKAGIPIKVFEAP